MEGLDLPSFVHTKLQGSGRALTRFNLRVAGATLTMTGLNSSQSHIDKTVVKGMKMILCNEA